METKHTFGIWLGIIRKARGYTQNELATKIDRSVEALSNIERGKSLPGYDMIYALCKVLEVSPEEMFQMENEEISPRRVTLMTKLQVILNQLNDKDLELAVAQIDAIRERASS